MLQLDLKSFHQKHFPTAPLPGLVVEGFLGPGCNRPAGIEKQCKPRRYDDEYYNGMSLANVYKEHIDKHSQEERPQLEEYYESGFHDEDYPGIERRSRDLADDRSYKGPHDYDHCHEEFCFGGTYAAIETSYECDHNNDDEDLSFYPDGVERTLTDDQVAIFRRSELQVMVRRMRTRADEYRDLKKYDIKRVADVYGLGTREGAELNRIHPKVSRRTQVSLTNPLQPEQPSGGNLVLEYSIYDDHLQVTSLEAVERQLPFQKLPLGPGVDACVLQQDTPHIADPDQGSGVKHVKQAQSNELLRAEISRMAETIAQRPPIPALPMSIVPSTISSDVPSSAAHSRNKHKRRNKNRQRKLHSRSHERQDKSEFMDDSDDKAKTYRRQARESDEQRGDHIILEY